MKKKTNDNVSAKTHFLSAKCPHCGATLTIENGIDSFFCQYCGTRLILANQSAEAIKAKAAKQKQEHRENMTDKVINHFNEIAARRAAEKERQRKYSKRAAIFSLIFFLIGVGLFFAYSNMQKKQSQSEEADLQLQLELIEEDINSGDYDKALVKANNLFYTSGYSQDVKKKWDNTRATLIKQIEEAKEAELDKQRHEPTESETFTDVLPDDTVEDDYEDSLEDNTGDVPEDVNENSNDEYQQVNPTDQLTALPEKTSSISTNYAETAAGDENSKKSSSNDIIHSIEFSDSYSAKRAHYTTRYYISYDRKEMISYTTGRDHGNSVNKRETYQLEISDENDGKIIRWYDSTGSLCSAYIKVEGNKVYWYGIDGKLNKTYDISTKPIAIDNSTQNTKDNHLPEYKPIEDILPLD